MPYIIAKIQAGAGGEQKRRLLKELTEVTVESLGVSPEVVRVVIEETPDGNWAYAGKTSDELRGPDGRMPQIPFLIVRFTEGFPQEKKAALIAGLSRTAAAVLGTDLALVKGIFEEVSLDAWANGGVLLSELRRKKAGET